jgi:cytochrome P450
MTLLFAGHDTTTSTVAFLFYELARNPHEQEPLRAELAGLSDGRAAAATKLADLSDSGAAASAHLVSGGVPAPADAVSGRASAPADAVSGRAPAPPDPVSGRAPALADPAPAPADSVSRRAPASADLGLPRLEMAIDETLRKYPPAWIGPRRSVEPFELEGVRVPGGVMVNYCSWASHWLPEVFPEPERFRPERFTPEATAALPKGAYVPFGGGSRTCIGMRFGLLEVKAIASSILGRFSVELAEPERPLSIRQMPTLSPRGGLPMVVRPAA